MTYSIGRDAIAATRYLTLNPPHDQFMHVCLAHSPKNMQNRESGCRVDRERILASPASYGRRVCPRYVQVRLINSA